MKRSPLDRQSLSQVGRTLPTQALLREKDDESEAKGATTAGEREIEPTRVPISWRPFEAAFKAGAK